MTQEQKELLLKDLCARLPYGVKIKFDSIKETVFTISELGYLFGSNHDIIPYLRPMESMTEEEKTYQMKLIKDIKHGANIDKLEDFYHSHHFDYRGLIPMGLALEAPEDMYN